MPSQTTTAVGATTTTILSVESMVPLIDWLAVHYSVTPMPTEATERALALLLLVTGGTVLGGVWYVVRAVARKWLVKHQIPLPETTEPSGSGQ